MVENQNLRWFMQYFPGHFVILQTCIRFSKNQMKPMIKYRGGKSKEIPNIMWHIPRFTGRYIEPFLGGGALFFYLVLDELLLMI